MRSLYDIYIEDNVDVVNEDKLDNFLKYFFDHIKILASLKQISKDIIKKSSKEILLQILNVYYVIIDSDIPIKEKMAAITCILYIISPVDSIMDYLPGGYADDIAMLMYTVNFLRKYITPDIKRKSEEKYNEWFSK